MAESELKNMKSEAPKSSAGAYLGYLFLMMADGRYKPVKKFLHMAFLVEKQQYPRNRRGRKLGMRTRVNVITLFFNTVHQN